MRYKLPVVEDAAQSFGALSSGRRSCGLTTIGCTSFFPSKPLGCYGDGGACFTNDDQLGEIMRQIRTHGQSKRYYHTRLGLNGRFDTLQAAFLLEKMAIFPEEIELRQDVAARYSQWLPKAIQAPKIKAGNQSVFAQYTIQVDQRTKIQEKLQAAGIPTAVHYPIGLHQQPIMQRLYPTDDVFQHTEFAADRVMSLPMHPYLTSHEQQQICQTLEEALIEDSIMA
jgi:UDP-2-acetamido-2-deoxy-ribo-hexuluronate aminotransferase